MKPLRFRLLPRQRSLKIRESFFRISCALLALAISGASLAAEPEKTSDERAKQLLKEQVNCKKNRTYSAKSIYADEPKLLLRNDFNWRVKCVQNAGDETTSHNAKAMLSPVDVVHRRPSFFSALPTEQHDQGACRAIYEGMKETYDYVVGLQRDYCDMSSVLQQAAMECGNGLPEKKCESEWKAIKEDKAKWISKLEEIYSPTKRFMEALSSANVAAREKYLSDFQRLDPVLGKRNPAAASRAQVDSISEASDIKVSDGNKVTAASKQIGDYFNLLAPPTGPLPRRNADPLPAYGPLIEEHREAGAKLESFLKILSERIDGEIKRTRFEIKTIEEQLARVEKNGALKNSPWSNMIKQAPDVTGAATSLLKTNTPANSETPNSSGGSGHGPLADLAAVGAVGAAGAIAASSLHNNSGASRPLDEAIAPAPTPSNPKGKGDDEVVKFSDPRDSANNVDKGNAPTNPLTVTKNDTPKTEFDGGGGGGGSFSAEGASRAIANMKKNPTGGSAPAPGGTVVDGGGSGTSDGFNAFNQNLEPKPVPKAPPASNPGNEVANLLGQMKNLFNFDDPNMAGGASAMPGGGAPGMDPYSSASAGPDGTGGVTTPPPEDGTGGATTAEGAAPEQQATEATAANGAVGESTGEILGNQLGRTDTSLFARVRARHHKCMQRGLVLYGLGERVE